MWFTFEHEGNKLNKNFSIPKLKCKMLLLSRTSVYVGPCVCDIIIKCLAN